MSAPVVPVQQSHASTVAAQLKRDMANVRGGSLLDVKTSGGYVTVTPKKKPGGLPGPRPGPGPGNVNAKGN